MPGDFLDTNIIVYLMSGDPAKAGPAKALIAEGGSISVQVLNEFANVTRRKMGRPWSEVGEKLETLKALLTVVPLTIATHETGIRLAERYGLAIYDAQLAASALLAGCETLWSEDMHDGLLIDGKLRIRNPFRQN